MKIERRQMYRSKTHGYLVVVNNFDRYTHENGSYNDLWMTDIPSMATNSWKYDAKDFFQDFVLLTESQREEELSKLTIDQLFLLEEQLANGQKN